MYSISFLSDTKYLLWEILRFPCVSSKFSLTDSVQGKSCLVRKYQHCHLGKRLEKYHHHLDFRYGAPAPPTFSVHNLAVGHPWHKFVLSRSVLTLTIQSYNTFFNKYERTSAVLSPFPSYKLTVKSQNVRWGGLVFG